MSNNNILGEEGGFNDEDLIFLSKIKEKKEQISKTSAFQDNIQDLDDKIVDMAENVPKNKNLIFSERNVSSSFSISLLNIGSDKQKEKEKNVINVFQSICLYSKDKIEEADELWTWEHLIAELQ
jgi:hypothetical protein